MKVVYFDGTYREGNCNLQLSRSWGRVEFTPTSWSPGGRVNRLLVTARDANGNSVCGWEFYRHYWIVSSQP